MGREESDMKGLITLLFIGFILVVYGQPYQTQYEDSQLQLQQDAQLRDEIKAKRDIWKTCLEGTRTPSQKSFVRLLKRTGAANQRSYRMRSGGVDIFTVGDIWSWRLY